MKVLALTGSHDGDGFDCGVEALNLRLRQTALQRQAKGICRSFLALPQDAQEAEMYRAAGYADIVETGILGYYALAPAFILAEDLAPELAKRYPRQIPVTRLGRLATRHDLQGHQTARDPRSAWGFFVSVLPFPLVRRSPAMARLGQIFVSAISPVDA